MTESTLSASRRASLNTLLCVSWFASVLAFGAEQPKASYDLPAGQADKSLRLFSSQSGLEVLFATEVTAGVRTNAVKGEFTPLEAVGRLLSGTSLTIVHDEKNGVLRVVRSPAPPKEEPGAAQKKKTPPVAKAAGHPAPSAGVPAQEEPVEMSPFVVTSESDRGYHAANTLAGTRQNTPLRDTAASISVLTEEFVRDIGALTLDEAVAFGNNVELDHTQISNSNGTSEFFSTFRIRGQAATVARNYFRWKLPTNTFNVERIEEARGPNSILFGIASSGGMISAQTKQASARRSFRRAQLVYGSHDLRQATVDLNQASFNGRLGARFNGVVSATQGYQHHEFNQDNRGHLAVRYEPAAGTVIRAEYEKGRTFRNTPDNQEVGDRVLKWIEAGRPLVGTPVADDARGLALQNDNGNQGVTYVENDGVFMDARGLAITQGAVSSGLIRNSPLVDPVDFTINVGGPGQTQATVFDTYALFLQQKLGRGSFLEFACNHQDYRFEAWQAFRYSGLQGDPNRFLKDGVTPNPHAGQLYFDTEWLQRLRHEEFDNYRLTASTEFDLGRWGSWRLAVLAEREESFAEKRNYTAIWGNPVGKGGAFSPLVTGSANTVKYRHYIIEGDFASYYASAANPGTAGYFAGVANPLVAGQTISARPAQNGNSDFSDPSEQDSYLAAAQAYFLQRRLVFAGGYRADSLHLHEGFRGATDPVTGDFIVDNVNFPRTDRTFSGRTKTYGAVWHLRPGLALRYNRSDSFELPNTGVRLIARPDASGHFIGGRIGDNPRGVGEDYGFDLDLFEGRIFIRATRFETIRAGAQQFQTPNSPQGLSNRVMDALLAQGLITLAERELHRIESGGTETDTESTGHEISVTANLTPDWRLQANYSHTDSVTTNYGPEIKAWAAVEIPYLRGFDQTLVTTGGLTVAQEIAGWEASDVIARSVEGQATIGNRAEKFSVVTRYSFSGGPLQGFGVGATARHQSRNVIGVRATGEWVYGNSFTRLDALLGYRFGRNAPRRFLRGLGLKLNVYNVFNRHAPLILNVADVNAAPLAVNRLLPQEPRTWRLAVDLSF